MLRRRRPCRRTSRGYIALRRRRLERHAFLFKHINVCPHTVDSFFRCRRPSAAIIYIDLRVFGITYQTYMSLTPRLPLPIIFVTTAFRFFFKLQAQSLLQAESFSGSRKCFISSSLWEAAIVLTITSLRTYLQTDFTLAYITVTLRSVKLIFNQLLPDQNVV